MIAQFVCTSTQALDPAVLKITGTSPLTLLLYLQQRVNFTTGERTLPYDHARAALDLGVSERTIGEYFVRLVKAGLITAQRLAHGVTFAITRPAAPGSERKESSVHFHAQEPEAPPERQESAPHERQESAAQPSRGENPDSERTNQRAAVGGGGPVVGGPTALAPPLAPDAALAGSSEPARIAAVVRLLEARGHDCTLQPWDKNAILHCKAPPEEIVACFDDILGGRFGTDALRQRVNVERAIEKLPNWRSQQAGVRSPRAGPASPQDYIREAMAREAAYGAD